MRTILKIGAVATSLLAIGTVASAAAEPEPTVSACVGKLTGLVRVIDPAKKQTCTSLERPMSWNQRGVPGPAGAVGPAGPAGAQGPQGPAGADNTLWGKVQTRDGGGVDVYKVTVASQRHVTGALIRNDHHYRVTFDRPVDQCAAQVTAVNNAYGAVDSFGLPTNELDVAFFIQGWDPAVAADFSITVNC
ncbi:collagen-like protein [Kribbella sp. NPDC051587]|uniref:collagen-like protein n=1 Tax=Kribbella sp. NPDC051587 TaxID=3364119 RepID=UPI0037A185E7